MVHYYSNKCNDDVITERIIRNDDVNKSDNITVIEGNNDVIMM